MHAVSSDDEAPTDLQNHERFDPKKIRKRIRKQAKRGAKMNQFEAKRQKKRTKKIVKKLREEAFSCKDYNRSTKNLTELQQLIIKNKVSLIYLIDIEISKAKVCYC